MPQSALQKTDKIAAILLDTPLQQDIGLYSGHAGIALFLFYYARLKNEVTIHKQASEILDNLFCQIEAEKHKNLSSKKRQTIGAPKHWRWHFSKTAWPAIKPGVRSNMEDGN